VRAPAPVPILFAAALAAGGVRGAEVPDGRDIVQRMHDVDSSVDGERLATMAIERGSRRLVRRLAIRTRKVDDGERMLIRFLEPADVRDTQYLSWSHDAVDRNDDLWVFFPTENLVRRISGGGKKGSFMRSDFANEDIEERSIDDDTHEFIDTATLGDREVYVVESRPIPIKASESNYAKRRISVDTETFLAHKVEYYDRRDRLIKVLSQDGFERIDGIWTATRLVMETPLRHSRTVLEYTDVRYNLGLPVSAFEQTALKR